MHIRAEIIVDSEADDYVGAADFQIRMKSVFQTVRADYPDARLVVKECRPRGRAPRASGDGEKTNVHKLYASGKVNRYEEG
jgi:hypothetical protein